MNFVTYFSLVPKIAVTVLIIVGILIVIEVVNLAKGSKKKTEQEEKLSGEKPLTPVTFPKGGIALSSSNPIPKPHHVPKRLIVTGVLLVIIVILGIIGSQFLPANNSVPSSPPIQATLPPAQPTIEQPAEQEAAQSSPTTAPELLPKIIIYQTDAEGVWQEIPKDDLSFLTPGQEIHIAVFSTLAHTGAQFIVNDETFTASPDQESPFGDLYINYPIQFDVLDYHIEVVLY